MSRFYKLNNWTTVDLTRVDSIESRFDALKQHRVTVVMASGYTFKDLDIDEDQFEKLQMIWQKEKEMV